MRRSNHGTSLPGLASFLAWLTFAIAPLMAQTESGESATTESSASTTDSAAATDSSAPAGNEAGDLPAGHSQHGEAFNEGPRQKAYLMGGTGPVTFPVTTENAEVKAFVEQGIGQLHGYWYLEAERSFRHAAMLEHDCAIAYWGMAMANTNNSKRAVPFIEEAVKRKDKAGRLEVMLIDSLHALLTSKDDNKKKHQAYVAALDAAAKEFPDEVEAQVASAYAWYKYRTDIGKSYEDVDAALKRVLDKVPLHSTHHFRIHLWDFKDAAKAVDSSALCGEGSPAIAHMWHMPGHIYSRLKRYSDAVWQQEASARVDHAHMMRDGVMPDQIHNFAHNNEWLIRNMGHIGRWRDGVDLAMNMTELPRHPKYNTFDRRGSAQYGRERLFEELARFEQWELIIDLCQQPYLEPTDKDTEQLKRLQNLGTAYARAGQTEPLDRVLVELDEKMKAAEQQKEKDRKEAEDKEAEEKRKQQEAREKERVAARDAGKPESPPKPDGRPKPPARKPDPTQPVTKAIAAVKGHRAFAAGDFALAVTELRKAGEDKLVVALAQSRAGQHDAAVKEAESYMKANDKEVVAMAGQIEILWAAGQKDKAREAFDALRELSGEIQLGTPVFERLQPIAAELQYPAEWRIAHVRPEDFGKRPDLDELGPFRWAPSAAKDWKLIDHAGTEHSLSTYKGRPVVVIFYLGYGCLHCAEQLQKFAPATQKFKDAGIDVIAISTDTQKDLKISVDNYEGGMPFPIVGNHELDVFKSWRVFDDFETKPLHGTFIIDEQGLIRWQDISYEPFMDPDFVLTEARRLLAQDDTPPSSLLKPQPPLAAAGAANDPAENITVLPAGELQPVEIPAAVQAQHPEGLPGPLLLTGSDKLPEGVVAGFLNLARMSQGRVVLVRFLDAGGQTPPGGLFDEDLLQAARSAKAEITQIVISRETAPQESVRSAIDSATGIWLSGTNASEIRDVLKIEPFAKSLVAAHQRDVVIAASDAVVPFISQASVSGDDAEHPLGLLPDSQIDIAANDAPTDDGANANAAGIHWQLPAGSAVLMRGRTATALGSQPVTIRLAATTHWPEFVQTLDESSRVADLIALRRQVVQRQTELFPTPSARTPQLENGSLILIGGGGTPKRLIDEFITRAGGAEKASIVVIPISSPDPLPKVDGFARMLAQRGVKNITVLQGRTPQAVLQPDALQALEKATGIWFGGGRQWRFVDAYAGTRAHELMHDVVRRGGVIAGSSSGASIQAEYLARGNPVGNVDVMAAGYDQGLGFLPGVAVDQHFTQRNRLPDMTSLVNRYPQLLGIGIDESTGIIVEGHIATVIGANRVCFYDRHKPVTADQPDYEPVGNDGQYDLATRKVLSAD